MVEPVARLAKGTRTMSFDDCGEHRVAAHERPSRNGVVGEIHRLRS
jgi:hypothetical protein